MFTSLSQFYNSTEWRKFRQLLINERINKADGILYDEYSGNPLVKSYDIVLHHIKPLTMQNVNDYSISLNPDNIQIVSQRSHNEIHSRFGYCAERKVYYVYGAPCSGKTTFVNDIKGNSDIIVDIDNIWQCITGGERYHKPDALKTNVFVLRDCLLDMIKTRAGKWERAWIISASPYQTEIDRMVKMLGAEQIEIESTKDECLQRLYSNPNGRNIEAWEGFINRYFEVKNVGK